VKRTMESDAVAFVRELADDWMKHAAPGPAKEAYYIWERYEAPTSCVRCDGSGVDPVSGPCTLCKGTGVDVDEDALLLGESGAVSIIFVDYNDGTTPQPDALRIFHTGGESSYRWAVQAAKRLEIKGLLKQVANHAMGETFLFTPRGTIAHEALAEAAHIAQEKMILSLDWSTASV
jgi:hypothetical protein